MKYQDLREIRQVTEYRQSEGHKAVYKTKSLGFAWVNTDLPYYTPDSDDKMSYSVSTKIRKGRVTNRTVSDDTPDVEFCIE